MSFNEMYLIVNNVLEKENIKYLIINTSPVTAYYSTDVLITYKPTLLHAVTHPLVLVITTHCILLLIHNKLIDRNKKGLFSWNYFLPNYEKRFLYFPFPKHC